MPDANGNLKPGDPGYIAPNTGLLNTVTPDKTAIGYTPTTTTSKDANAVGYQANPFTVSPDQTVQEQISKITSADSKLMQQARVRANQAAQQKGLLNSSIAVESGENAVISQALPIAQQDANTHAQASMNTVQAQNAAAFQEAQAKNQAALQNAQLGTNVNLANQQATNTAGAQNAQAANQILGTKLTNENQVLLAQMDNQTRLALTQLDNQYRQLLQQNQGMSSIFNQVLTDITNISTNTSMNRAAKERAVQTQLNFLREALAASSEVATLDAANIENLDLSTYFNRNTSSTGTPGTTSNGIVEPTPTHPSAQQTWTKRDGKTTNNINEAYKSWVGYGDGWKEEFSKANSAALGALHVPTDIYPVEQYVNQAAAETKYL